MRSALGVERAIRQLLAARRGDAQLLRDGVHALHIILEQCTNE